MNILESGTYKSTAQGLEAEILKDGYFVSLQGYQTEIEKELVSQSLTHAILAYYSKLAQRYSAYVGIWEESGKVYLDLTEHVADLDDAVQSGKRRNQKAIWDIVKNEPIHLERYPFEVNLDGKYKGISSVNYRTAFNIALGMKLRAEQVTKSDS